MDFSLKLKSSLIHNVTKKFKIWITKKQIVVIDIMVNGINIALDVVKNSSGIRGMIFGRDQLSQRIINDFLVTNNCWADNDRYNKKIIVGQWDRQDSIEEITLHLLNIANNIYEQLQESSRDIIYSAIDEIKQQTYEKVKKRIALNDQINIGFLVSERQKWNCQSLWDAFQNLPEVTCNIYLHVHDRSQLENQLEFFKNIDPNLICLYDLKLKKNELIKNYNLDFIFCQQPWTGLKKQSKEALDTSLILYMHYGFLVYANSKMQYQLWDFHPLIWRYFSQSELQKKIHLKYDPRMEDRQVVTGYPKLDVYLDTLSECHIWPESNTEKNKIIYAPHHSMKKDALKISTFPWNFNLLLELAKVYKNETQWVYKPHGRLRLSVLENNIMTSSEYNNYISEWVSRNNTTVYDEGNYFDLFRTSDVLITDCGSFLGEYFPTEKPIIWLVSDMANVELNEIGENLSTGFYKVRTKKELIDTFNEVVIKGNDPLKAHRRKIIKEVFPLNKKASDSIVDFLVEILNESK